MYKCKICGLECKTQRGLATHFRTHKMTKDEYLEKYGEYRDTYTEKSGLINCPICGKTGFSNLLSHVTRVHQMTKEEFQDKYPNTICFTESYHKQCSDACKKSLESQLANPEKWSESRKKAQRTRMRNNPRMVEIYTKAAHRGQSDRLKKMWKNPEYKKMMSDKCKEQHKNGLTEKIMGSTVSSANRRNYKFTTYYGEEIMLRSSWEMKLVLYFKNTV